MGSLTPLAFGGIPMGARYHEQIYFRQYKRWGGPWSDKPQSSAGRQVVLWGKIWDD